MFPTLETERFLLQQIARHDQRFVFEGLSHPQVIPFYGVRYESFEAAEKQMDWYDKNVRDGTGCAWKIIKKFSGEKIGVIAYYYFKPEHKKAEVGFWILPEYWNQGVISEALRVVVPFCQNEKGIHRLEAFVEDGNVASVRVLEKLGFILEGTMKECEIKDGRYISVHMYALVRGQRQEENIARS